VLELRRSKAVGTSNERREGARRRWLGLAVDAMILFLMQLWDESGRCSKKMSENLALGEMN
jgi:hypothetical protein